MSLIKYIIKRLIIAIPMFIALMILVWLFIGFMPGDPIATLIDNNPLYRDYSESQRAVLRAQLNARYGFDQPFFMQIYLFIKGLFIGDWGTTLEISQGATKDVFELIKVYFPHTMEITIIPIILVNIVAAKVGKYIAVNRGKKQDTFFRGASIMLIAVPSFWLALQLQLLFTTTIPNITGGIIDIPTVSLFSAKYLRPGYETPYVTGFRLIDTLLANQLEQFVDTLSHLILPSIVFFLTSFGSLTRPARSCMLDVLESDYIRTARAKGCSEKDVQNKHAFRNAIIPYSTFIGFNIAGFLVGAAFIELIFDFRGIGQAMLYAFQRNDYWMTRGCLVVFSFVNIIITLVVDVMYAVLDPRISY